MNQEELDKLAAAIVRDIQKNQKEVMTLDEVAVYTGLKKSYLYKLTSRRTIPHYKPNGKVCFFRRSELEEWMTSNPIATVEEINDRAMEYCMRKKPNN